MLSVCLVSGKVYHLAFFAALLIFSVPCVFFLEITAQNPSEDARKAFVKGSLHSALPRKERSPPISISGKSEFSSFDGPGYSSEPSKGYLQSIISKQTSKKDAGKDNAENRSWRSLLQTDSVLDTALDGGFQTVEARPDDRADDVSLASDDVSVARNGVEGNKLRDESSAPRLAGAEIIAEVETKGDGKYAYSHPRLQKAAMTKDTGVQEEESDNAWRREKTRKSEDSRIERTEKKKANVKRKKRARKQRSSVTTICWDGPAEEWGGQAMKGPLREPSSETFSETDTTHNILITGEGCSQCIVGQLCRFALAFAGDIYFDWESPFAELMVLLNGPAVIAAEVQGGQHSGLTYVVSYTSWDPGMYRVAVVGDCCVSDETFSTTLASFDLFVHEAIPRAPSSHLRPLLSSPPCEEGLYARWVMEGDEDGNGEPRLLPYKCSGGLTEPQQFATALAARGVREISLLGDEHQRNLLLHLQYLLTGRVSGGLKEDIVWDHVDPRTGAQLRVNFYWLDGIFEEGLFDCFGRGAISGRRVSLPLFSNTSDIVIVNDGQWTFTRCKRAEQAYPHYLPQLLEWLTHGVPHKASTRFLWRSTPPYPMRSEGTCGGPKNSAIRWANELARDISERFGMEYLNLWPYEAVGYDDTCFSPNDDMGLGEWEKGITYSCLYHNHSKAYGVVGEGVVRMFVHILSLLEPLG